MITKIKQTKLEKYLIFFIVFLAIFSFGSLFILKNKCLFIKTYDPNNLVPGPLSSHLITSTFSLSNLGI